MRDRASFCPTFSEKINSEAIRIEQKLRSEKRDQRMERMGLWIKTGVERQWEDPAALGVSSGPGSHPGRGVPGGNRAVGGRLVSPGHMLSEEECK